MSKTSDYPHTEPDDLFIGPASVLSEWRSLHFLVGTKSPLKAIYCTGKDRIEPFPSDHQHFHLITDVHIRQLGGRTKQNGVNLDVPRN